jgi:hypothetical protein
MIKFMCYQDRQGRKLAAFEQTHTGVMSENMAVT